MDRDGSTRRSALSLFGGSALSAAAWADTRTSRQTQDDPRPSGKSDGLHQMAAAGGRVHVPAGPHPLSSGYVFAGQRLNMIGDGPNVSTFVFDAPARGAAVTLNTPGEGGQYQSSIRDIGFVAAGEEQKTAVHLVNAANINLERLAIPAGGWLGKSAIGIRTQGRQFIRVRDCDIACARPMVVGPNPSVPSLAADYLSISSCEFSCTIPDGAAIDVEDGATMANMSLRDSALTGGAVGFRYVDQSPPIAPNMNLEFENIRTEQGADSDGWSFQLESKNNTIQSVIMANVRMDNRRNGLKLRNVQRATLINCDIDQSEGHVALDMIGVPGSVLTMVNCWAQSSGRLRIQRMKKVTGLRSDIGSPIGPFEIWVYDDGDDQPFVAGNAWSAGSTIRIRPGEYHVICRNDCVGKIDIYASNGVSAGFRLFGTNNVSFKVDDPAGQFGTVYGKAGTTNVAYHDGYYVVQNGTTGTLGYRYQLTGPGNAGF